MENNNTVLFQGDMFRVTNKKSNDGTKIFQVAERAPGVRLIVPTLNGILLNYEYRHALLGWDHRLPGGKVCDTWQEYEALSKNGDKDTTMELAQNAAMKEGLEEQGLIIKKEDLQFFSIAGCGTTIKWDLYYFVVLNYVQAAQQLEHDENIEQKIIPYDQIGNLCLSDNFSEDRSSSVLMKYLHRTGKLFL